MKKVLSSEQSGRSMVEMLGVLAIIGVLSVGGISGYSKAMAKYRANKTLDQISLLITNIRTLYANQYNYTGLNNDALEDFELVSADMKSGTDYVNPFGGKIKIEATNGNANFAVTYTGLDKQACITMATADWGSTASSGLVSVAVGEAATTTDTIASATTFTWGSGTGSNSKTFPVSPVTASTACSGTENGITITYR